MLRPHRSNGAWKYPRFRSVPWAVGFVHHLLRFLASRLMRGACAGRGGPWVWIADLPSPRVCGVGFAGPKTPTMSFPTSRRGCTGGPISGSSQRRGPGRREVFNPCRLDAVKAEAGIRKDLVMLREARIARRRRETAERELVPKSMRLACSILFRNLLTPASGFFLTLEVAALPDRLLGI